MTVLEVREEIFSSHNYATNNDFIDAVIRLYISNGDDITIWEESTGFKFSSGDCAYFTLDELLDDLCDQFESNRYNVTDVEIE